MRALLVRRTGVAVVDDIVNGGERSDGAGALVTGAAMYHGGRWRYRFVDALRAGQPHLRRALFAEWLPRQAGASCGPVPSPYCTYVLAPMCMQHSPLVKVVCRTALRRAPRGTCVASVARRSTSDRLTARGSSPTNPGDGGARISQRQTSTVRLARSKSEASRVLHGADDAHVARAGPAPFGTTKVSTCQNFSTFNICSLASLSPRCLPAAASRPAAGSPPSRGSAVPRAEGIQFERPRVKGACTVHTLLPPAPYPTPPPPPTLPPVPLPPSTAARCTPQPTVAMTVAVGGGRR